MRHPVLLFRLLFLVHLPASLCRGLGQRRVFASYLVLVVGLERSFGFLQRRPIFAFSSRRPCRRAPSATLTRVHHVIALVAASTIARLLVFLGVRFGVPTMALDFVLVIRLKLDLELVSLPLPCPGGDLQDAVRIESNMTSSAACRAARAESRAVELAERLVVARPFALS